MKKSQASNKTKYILISVITVIALAVAIGFIVFFSNNSTQNNPVEQQNQKHIESNEPEESTEQEESIENSEADKEEGLESTPDEEEKTNEEETQNETPPAAEEKDDKVTKENGYIVGQMLPTEPTYVDGVLIANKKYPLPQNYNPGENVEARAAFEEMAQAARKEGIELTAFSTFRSFEYQQSLYKRYVDRDGKDNADRYSARPGYSEHQTGLAFDIGEVGKEDLWLTSEFGESTAGKWLVNNAHNYGFILRYPKGKEEITGYMYESWHFRYLGVPLATDVKNSGVTLEEYLGIQ
ncbi:D-alanyl-D-alanine carboxypeptidase [Ureibacillus massiliensis 4400831 = CIP 108448 = CCUG 49529]|uniref:D-alanyl-D-alanine carboxypeptidase n=1 Tax=Ureibacillus massiliensis 4400831 = CIP 108448 = CCUG 49529 TaxID=1211035 RepID=A0A0A3J488_9BACL|nr:M15 family metallopeptidase [Ureibacillus massiliensis]KGR91819.1 D-alanyl-D-alanine carboxypeptidase [Ureibacillus massiliensis 4400831 = CIP 108448 = CCUG 49529]